MPWRVLGIWAASRTVGASTPGRREQRVLVSSHATEAAATRAARALERCGVYDWVRLEER